MLLQASMNTFEK